MDAHGAIPCAFLYDESNRKLKRINFAGVTRIEPKLDCLGRNKGKTLSYENEKIYSEDITYLKQGDHATALPLTISYGRKTDNGFAIKENIKYKYDNMGNITKVYENGELVTEYKYDALNRLVRENNKILNKTYVFLYDNKGNIIERKEYPFTLKCDQCLEELSSDNVEYIYSNGKLVSYNGEAIVYDVLGNPTSYRGNTLSWRFGKRLMSYGSNTFIYDAEGKRTQKNGITYTYHIDGKLFAQSNGFEFFYDNNDSLIAFAYLGEVYYYKKDLLGNVIEILDTTGKTVVKYVYDAWGNHTVTDYTDFNLGNINPIRYRSYYFDTETGLYFLQTRYYDPQTGRFINIDDISYLDPETINGLNLYAYCGNNPVNCVDYTGHAPEWLWNVLVGVGIIVGTVLFVAAIIASAGAVGALAGAGAAALGLSAATVSTVATVATVSTYVVATGVGLFGLSDSIEAFTGGFNPIRDCVMGGNQTAYNVTSGIFNALGNVAVLAGTFGPKILQKIASKWGTPKISKGSVVGHQITFYDKKGNWNFRIDATVHNPNGIHHNPHVHLLEPDVKQGGISENVYYFWEVVKRFLRK